MTERTRRALDWISIAAIATVFGAGSAYAYTQSRIGTLEDKVDVIVRFICHDRPSDFGCQAVRQ